MIAVPTIFDAHLHLRQGDMLKRVRKYSAQNRYAIVMPNTVPPITTVDAALAYKDECGFSDCTTILPTLKLTKDTTTKTVHDAKSKGIIGFKSYPDGVTTHSSDGISRSELTRPSAWFRDILTAIESEDLVLLQHGEMPGEFCLDRETKYLEFFVRIAAEYPNLRMTLEHITTEAAVNTISVLAENRGKVAGTITLHHLKRTLDNVIGDLLQPDEFCKPIPKKPSDKLALLAAAFSGAPHFFFGSDSAPHLKAQKYRAGGCAGVFSAPVLIPALVELFMRDGKMAAFGKFTSANACKFYGLDLPDKMIEVYEKRWVVPSDCSGITPFMAGEAISWSTDIMTGL